MKEVVLLNRVNIEGVVLSANLGQITFTADFRIGEKTYSNLAFLRLHIEYFEEDEPVWVVTDDYPSVVSSLKLSKVFRDYFTVLLARQGMHVEEVKNSQLLLNCLRVYTQLLTELSEEVGMVGRDNEVAVQPLDCKNKEMMEEARALLGLDTPSVEFVHFTVEG